jgi:hypothetical protein
MIFHNWLIPLAVVIVLGTIANRTEELMFIAYFSLFGLLYIIGNGDFFVRQKPENNGYKILGSIGTIVLLITTSFDSFWENLKNSDLQLNEVIIAPEFWTSTILSLFALLFLYLYKRKRTWKNIEPLAPMFILFILTFLLGLYSPIAVVIINLYVFGFGILTIRQGAKQDHFGLLNFGLLIITALVICRFFDTDLSFVFKGIMFLTVGSGFFAANYWMLKKRKTNE